MHKQHKTHQKNLMICREKESEVQMLHHELMTLGKLHVKVS